MALSIDYTLPKNQDPLFPDRCVACGEQHFEEHIKITTQATSLWTWIMPLFFKLHSVKVPCCASCSGSIKLRRWGGFVLSACFLFLVFWLVDPFVSEFLSGQSRKFAILALALVAFSPLALIAAFYPPAIDITAFSDHVDYEFRDLDYAVEFAVLNGVDGDDENDEVSRSYDDLNDFGSGADADDENEDKRYYDDEEDFGDDDDEDDEDDDDDDD